MARFKGGVKVRVVDSGEYGGEAAKGAEGVVREYRYGCVQVELTKPALTGDGNVGIGFVYSYDEDQLEPIASTPRFKVGDKVRVTMPGVQHHGKVGVVSQMRTGDLSVEFSGDQRAWPDYRERYEIPYGFDGVEKVVEPRKFEVGDKVRVVTDDVFGADHEYVGRVGTVTHIVDFGYPYHVDFGGGDWMRYHDDELEAYVEPQPTTKSKFNVGDRVRVYQTALRRERTGVITDQYDNLAVQYNDAISNGFDYMYHVEVLEVLAPPSTLPLGFVAPTDHAHIDNATIERWVEVGVKNVKAQETLGYDEPRYETMSGDALLVVERGQAKLYRLEGVKNVE